MSFFVGSTLTFTKKFVDANGADADPSTVKFYLREGIDGVELEWTFNAAPVEGTHYPIGFNPIVKDSTGDYHVLVVARKPERQTGAWRGVGGVNDSSQTTYFVRHSEVSILDAGSFPSDLLNARVAELEWQCTVNFGVAGAATLDSSSSAGGSVTHDGAGHYTLTFPSSTTVFIESLVLLNATGNANTAHPHDLVAGQATIHTEVNGTQTDPDNGGKLFVVLRLRF